MSKLPRLRKTAEPDRDGRSDAGYAVGYGRPDNITKPQGPRQWAMETPPFLMVRTPA